VFIDGESQAFVGSACTIEIVDAAGRSLKNIAAPWGNSFLFTIIDAPDGSRELVSARWPNGYDNLHIVNSRTLALRTGFNSWPAGHTAFNPWTGVNRVRLVYEDLDGDDTKELVTAVNGDWNRMALWAANGRILHSVHFGPGRKGPGSTIPDMDVADLDGDGKKEILVARTDGLLVALSHRGEEVWSRRLPSAPRVLRCVPSRIVVGCDDGAVLSLDPGGTSVRMGKIRGTPTRVGVISSVDTIVYVGSDKGQIKAFQTD